MKQTKTGYVKRTANIDHFPEIKGYDFSQKFNLKSFLKAYATTGMQATHLAQAIEIIKAMRREKATIFLSYTSNMVTSGVREAISYLVQHKMVDVLITPAGGIEEDIMKTLKPFNLGSFKSDGKFLFEEGVNRAGNVFIADDRYAYLEKFMTPIFDEATKIQEKRGSALSATELIALTASKIEDTSSILYWAHKNNIPIFCPAPTDGSLGDLLFFQKQRKKEFQLDVLGDMKQIVNLALQAEKTGIICLGGGVSKHFALNAQIFREGADFAVLVNSAAEFDGSDSGAATDEAVSWGKIKAHAPQVKVTGDATILFPLILAGVLEK